MISRRVSLLVLTSSIILGSYALCLHAAENPAEKPAAKPLEEGWIALFNGQDLTGWKASEMGEWKVEDGVIVTPPKKSHLFSDQEFTNFDFKAEVMTAPGSNSGIY